MARTGLAAGIDGESLRPAFKRLCGDASYRRYVVDGARSSQPGSSLPPEAAPFRCDVSLERAAVTVRPVGELDVSTVPVLAARIAELRHAGFRQVVLDLSGLLFIDSSGLHMIIDCEAKARQDGFAFDLIPGSRPIQRVFEITGLAGRLPFRDSEDRGPNSLGGAA